MGIILGASDLLIRSQAPDEMRQDLQIIKDSAKRGVEITKSLLFFAKDQEPRLKYFDINETISKANIIWLKEGEYQQSPFSTISPPGYTMDIQKLFLTGF